MSPAGLAGLALVNPDLEDISPIACALRLDTIPSLGEDTVRHSSAGARHVPAGANFGETVGR